MITFNRLFQYMAENDISQKDLSKKTGITLSTIARLRRNENVSLSFISKICLAYNIPIEAVIEYTPEEN